MSDQVCSIRTFVIVVLVLLLNACADPQVVRVFDGTPVTGRFIDYEAYAAYGRGLEAERDGHDKLAARWFQEAAQYDPKSVEIWTHLGAASCSPQTKTQTEALEAFDHAEQIDPTYEPLFRARARCALAWSKMDAALAFAAHAVELDPEQDDAVVLYADLLERRDKPDDAKRLLEGHLLRHPTSIPGWRARYDLAKHKQDTSAMKHSAEALLRLAPRMTNELVPEVPTLGPLTRVDEAIRQGNIEEARKAARQAHLPPGELAVRAAAIGASKLAREQAEHVLGADPASASARVALASASDALADPQSVGVALELPKGDRITPLSPLARLVFAELLVRRTSRDAARAFVGSLESDGTNDPVYESLRAHLVTRIGETNVVKHGGS